MDFAGWRDGSAFLMKRRRARCAVKNAIRSITVIATAVSTTQIASALEVSDVLAYSLGPVSLRPQVSAFSEFNDNIFFRQTNVESDLIFGISPGIRALMGDDLPDQNHISLSYKLEQDFYIDHSELNAMQHRFAFDGFYGTEKTQIQGSDRVEFLSSTLGGGFSSVTGLKVNRTVWSDVYSINHRFGQRMASYFRVEHGSIDYDQGIRLFDVSSLEGALGFEWLLSERTRLFGEGYFGRIFVDNNGIPAVDPPSSDFGGGFIGARGDFTEKLSGIAKAGYEFYQFDHSTSVGGSRSGSAPVFETSLSYLLTERTTLTLDYRRRQQVSAEYSQTAYVADEVRIGAASRLGSSDRLRADVAGRLGFYSYDRSPFFSKRDDVIWGVTAGATWLFQAWLTARLEYNFNQLSSDLPTIIEYGQHRITLTVSAGY